jgi:integrase
MDIHNAEIRLNECIRKFTDDASVSPRNKHLILDFLDYLLADGLSQIRVMKYLYTLKKVVTILGKDFDSITKNDAIQFFKYINTNRNFEEWTKHDYCILTRRFYQWIEKEVKITSEETKEAISEITHKEIKKAKSREKLPEHLLTPEEVMKIADYTLNSRDKAFVLAFYESACRIGEILPTKIKDIEFDKYGCRVNITGKTGFRPVRLCASAPAISNWLDNHPDRKNPNAFLFCGIGRNNYKEMLSYDAARKVIFKSAEKVGITKRVNLHKFRASRATQLVLEGMSEPVLCNFGGWVIGSSEIRTYVKLSGKNVEDEILRINGLVEKTEDKNSFKLIICPRCHVKNTPGSNFCSSCSLALDLPNLMKTEEDAKSVGFNIMDLMKNPNFTTELANLLVKEYAKQQKEKA